MNRAPSMPSSSLGAMRDDLVERAGSTKAGAAPVGEDARIGGDAERALDEDDERHDHDEHGRRQRGSLRTTKSG